MRTIPRHAHAESDPPGSHTPPSAALSPKPVQFESGLLEPEINLARVIGRIHAAREQQAEIVVFSERALTGSALSAKETQAMAEPIPGPRIHRLAVACREAGILAVVGTLEPGGGCGCSPSDGL